MPDMHSSPLQQLPRLRAALHTASCSACCRVGGLITPPPIDTCAMAVRSGSGCEHSTAMM